MNIYFIQAENGLIAIGSAENVGKRYRTLVSASPTSLKILRHVKGTKRLEREWKSKFKSTHHHGNWFSPTEDMIKFINELPDKSAEFAPVVKSLPPEFEYKNSKSARRSLVLSQWQEQIVLGSLLGLGGIAKPLTGKNCYFTIRQSKQCDKKWLLYKADEVKDFARFNSFYEDTTSYYWSSVCDPSFNKYRGICYEEGKKRVTMEWLDMLQDIGLAIWFGDKGEWLPDGRLYLKVANLKGSETVIEQFFNEVGIPCSVNASKLIFSDTGKMTFLKLIAHRLPYCMHNKLES